MVINVHLNGYMNGHINGLFLMNVDPNNHINHDMNDHKMFI